MSSGKLKLFAHTLGPRPLMTPPGRRGECGTRGCVARATEGAASASPRRVRWSGSVNLIWRKHAWQARHSKPQNTRERVAELQVLCFGDT